jgi:hypothetical protein
VIDCDFFAYLTALALLLFSFALLPQALYMPGVKVRKCSIETHRICLFVAIFDHNDRQIIPPAQHFFRLSRPTGHPWQRSQQPLASGIKLNPILSRSFSICLYCLYFNSS